MIEIPKKEPLNIVPFIDIMLVLLAMVLSISTFIAKGEIQISLPESKTSTPPAAAPEPPVLLQVDASGSYFWESRSVTLEEVRTALGTTPKERRLLLRIDRAADFEHFIRLVDVIRAQGHENFKIATEQKPD